MTRSWVPSPARPRGTVLGDVGSTLGESLFDKLVERGGDGLWGLEELRRETFAPSMPVRREET
jgi:hypothetical protein